MNEEKVMPLQVVLLKAGIGDLRSAVSAGSETRAEQGMAVRAEHGTAVRAEQGMAVRAEHGMGARAEHGMAARAEHRMSARAEHGMAARAEHRMAVRAEAGLVNCGERIFVCVTTSGIKRLFAARAGNLVPGRSNCLTRSPTGPAAGRFSERSR